ncbi:DUF397 domain-containing protein [Streptomyces fulvoviolaceus]|uniref:DUF397 domain-containing protein n=1 Tax=Streptomyces fulvoviolaceus TaxID=285535 RepID=UPI0021BEB434|nr:DUF397 domain-containing protein [Streptomyces fulvoviolaceus]MCT9082099.1 DUF397 domain-containing protein [Streptomyces fulvoviolaceus]
MPTRVWQKSSYCQEGEACVHISATAKAVHLTESADPAQTILTTDPVAFGALLNALKSSAGQ